MKLTAISTTIAKQSLSQDKGDFELPEGRLFDVDSFQVDGSYLRILFSEKVGGHRAWWVFGGHVAIAESPTETEPVQPEQPPIDPAPKKAAKQSAG